MQFVVKNKNQVIEIDIEALKMDKKLWKAIKEKRKIWIEDYIVDQNGNAEFEFKIYLPN